MATTTAPAGYRTSYTVRQRSRAGEHEGDMEGSTHAATGALLGAGVALIAVAADSHGLNPWVGAGRVLLSGVLVAGFALLPDADHPQASFAYAAGPLSHGISHLVAVASGGHRQGMHSLFGIGLVAAGTQACAVWFPNRWALGSLALLMAICIAASLHATGFTRHRLMTFAVSAGIAGTAIAMPGIRPDLWWLAALGMALHIFEDEFTGHGCALLWPVLHRRFGGDGRQPAVRRAPAPRRAPQSGFRQARQRAVRPAAGPKPARTIRPTSRPAAATPPPAAPVPRLVRGPVSMCPHCWVGECDRCKGEGCKCPEPAAAHPARKAAAAAAQPRPGLPPDPPF
jgi:membrane-bound metal-dependent hydrolase YbcI (DUF457 family)